MVLRKKCSTCDAPDDTPYPSGKDNQEKLAEALRWIHLSTSENKYYSNTPHCIVLILLKQKGLPIVQ